MYLDYYKEWVQALYNAQGYYDMKGVYVRGTAFIGILNELRDADMIDTKLALKYVTEVNEYTNKSLKIFLN